MLFNRDKIILDLCGGTGAWSRPYKDAGYDVRVITLPGHDVIDYIPPEDVYGILAAPPCKEFSIARQRNRYMEKAPDRDMKKGMSTVNACMRIIATTKPVFWALENPTGLLSRYLGKPRYVFHPFYYGDPWTKRTALWGNFKTPRPTCYSQENCLQKGGITDVGDYFKRQKICGKPRPGKTLPSRADMDLSHFKFVGMGEERSAFRAITPSGFAKAFFEANR